MADIFISYKREEAEQAELLASTLEQFGFSVWWDNALLSGDEFRNVIREMIDQSTIVIVLWSPKAVRSQFVVDEATLAQREEKLMPVFLEPCDLPFGFGNQHADNLEGWDGSINHSGFSRLLKSIEKIMGRTARLGSKQGSSPAQQAEIQAFQTAAKLNSKGAWNIFLNDYPATKFRKFIESHLGEKLPPPPDTTDDHPVSKAPPAPQQASQMVPVSTVPAQTHPPKKKVPFFAALVSFIVIAGLGAGFFMWNADSTSRASDDAAWKLAATENKIFLYKTYLQTYPEGEHTQQARLNITTLETEIATKADDLAWKTAQDSHSISSYAGYLAIYPDGQYAQSAKRATLRLEKQKTEARALEVKRRKAEKAKTSDKDSSSFLGSIITKDQMDSLNPDAKASDKRTTSIADSLKLNVPTTNKKLPSKGIVRLSPAKVQTQLNGRDCPDCPDMVRIPTGSFTMGTQNGKDDEAPARQVYMLKSISVGKYEITFNEWGACVNDGGCNHRPYDKRWGRGTRPVINVSWNDTQVYLKWLSEKTGKTYRLLSEAEWEYIARAGTNTEFPWGNSLSHENANYGSKICCSGKVEGRDQWEHTAPVGSFNANRFGLHDTQGNVWEWVEDCWIDDYKTADKTPRARTLSHCTSRVLRGGSWDSRQQSLRSANRNHRSPSRRTTYYGFRVAKTN